jgi:hypothetical protein
MPNYAFIENNVIVNIIIAEDLEVAQSVTDKEVALCDDGKMVMGADLFEGQWRLPKPFPSWSWENGDWVAPVLPPEPRDCYSWNEESGQWEQKPGEIITWKINEAS